MSYIQKPIDQLELRYRLESFVQLLTDSKSHFFFHKNGNELIRIKKVDIVYLEAEGNYVILFNRNEKHMIRSSLKTLLQKIDSSTLMQIHRKWVISLDLVHSYNFKTKKADLGGLPFPVSRKFQSKLSKHLVNS